MWPTKMVEIRNSTNALRVKNQKCTETQIRENPKKSNLQQMQVIAILGTVHIPDGFPGVKGNKAGTKKNIVENKGT